jgi:hypothetical protein
MPGFASSYSSVSTNRVRAEVETYMNAMNLRIFSATVLASALHAASTVKGSATGTNKNLGSTIATLSPTTAPWGANFTLTAVSVINPGTMFSNSLPLTIISASGGGGTGGGGDGGTGGTLTVAPASANVTQGARPNSELVKVVTWLAAPGSLG